MTSYKERGRIASYLTDAQRSHAGWIGASKCEVIFGRVLTIQVQGFFRSHAPEWEWIAYGFPRWSMRARQMKDAEYINFFYNFPEFLLFDYTDD
ncbi:MAG: hypothetical protein HF982_10535 [Desulfobacteraceae bacterium]|nr:hypothetical protein [Desulfobacteraceae bacterium]MBC2720003.1 hypothetical protein [Desulfobacteraceae bacterium]